jgi:hypothetical protein
LHIQTKSLHLIAICILPLLAACLVTDFGLIPEDEKEKGGIPADFLLILDADSADKPVHNVNIRINAQGEGRYERYDTGGVIRGDENDMVTYDTEQVVEAGEFSVSEDALRGLWEAIEENRFFELTGDYRMAMGFSYAFIVVEADGRKHQVFNIGMEVPEIRAIVEATDRVLPEGVDLAYREGY